MMICHSNSKINLEYVKYLNLIYLQTKMKNELYHSIRDNKLQKKAQYTKKSETLNFTFLFFLIIIMNNNNKKT